MLTVYDYLVIICYLCFLIGVGWIFHRSARNSDEYFRGSGQMEWWLVGASTFMASFSAWTFTGASGLAYQYGVVVFIMYLGNVLYYIVQWLWLAKWFRQTRVIVIMEAVRARFGRINEQFFIWLGLPTQVLVAGIWLYGLAIFCAPAFGIDLRLTILVCGAIVVFIAVSGGSWAVTVGDFLQALMLVPITIVLAVYSLQQIGGLHNLIAKLPASSLVPLGPEAAGFGIFWAFATIFETMFNSGLGLSGSAARYLGVRNGKEASRAALLAACLFLVGTVIWFIPPLTARALQLDVASMFPNLTKPEEGAYVAMARICLPAGLMGLLVTGIMSTTISAMDMGLSRNSGIFVRSFYLPILRPKASEKELVIVGRLSTLILGIFIIMLALLYSTWKGLGVLDLMLNFGALVGVPSATPLLWCLVTRRTPDWAAWSTTLVGLGAGTFFGLLPAIPGLQHFADSLGIGGYFNKLAHHDYAMTILTNCVLCSSWFFGATLAFPLPPGSKRQVEIDAFLATMKRPLSDSEQPDPSQVSKKAMLISKMAMTYGLFICTLLLIPNNLLHRAGILFCALFIGLAGYFLRRTYLRRQKRAQNPLINEKASPSDKIVPSVMCSSHRSSAPTPNPAD